MIKNSLREQYEKKRKERQDILDIGGLPEVAEENKSLNLSEDIEIEKCLINILADKHLVLPTNSIQIMQQMSSKLPQSLDQLKIYNLLQKIAQQQIIELKNVTIKNEAGYEIIQINNDEFYHHYHEIINEKRIDDENWTDLMNMDEKEPPEKKQRINSSSIDASDIMSLLSLPTAKEKEHKQIGEEILELLSKPTAKELQLAEKFRSQGGRQVMEFCPHATRVECLKAQQLTEESSNIEGKKSINLKCKKLHFKKIIQAHTDIALGDCSFLNTCFHMDTCKYVHYQVDNDQSSTKSDQLDNSELNNSTVLKRTIQTNGLSLVPPQWIQCDLRYLDMSCLGKFSVIMADPPWDIHMELPYGTLSDDEMRQLSIPTLQDEGLIFLWVTGRAMELGRDCLKLWGYERVDELIWVKTNQLQRIIRTGRTGHWLNHGKEHCLVGMKGNAKNMNRGLDCDVIVAEVRATSHKPDEIYGMIERLSPGTKKIELFGRQHNVQPNWLTIGNQLDGIKLVDPELIKSFQKRYPNGNCMIGRK